MTALPAPRYARTRAPRVLKQPLPWFTFRCQRCDQEFRARFIARECRSCWAETAAIYPTLGPGTGEVSGE